MSEVTEAVVKLGVILICLCALFFLGRGLVERFGVNRRVVLWTLVVIGTSSYINYGGFHTDGTPWHLWDQYHYVIGSKYFPELGYDGLYAASLTARAEQGLGVPERVRDLRDNKVVPVSEIAGFMRSVRARFSEARWAEFKTDTTHFYLRDEIFLDHGYNPTPAHTVVERTFTAYLPFRQRTVMLLAMLDFILLAVAGVVVYRVFGLETLAATTLAFGLGYCSRYYWIGGAFLRQDWITALVICAAALRVERYTLAGAFLAYAACCRVFPVLFVLPLAAFALAPGHRKHYGQAAMNFSLGFAALAALLAIAGCLAGRGPGAWVESAHRLLLQTSAMGPNAIGLRVPFSASLANLRGELVDPTTLYEYSGVAADFAKTAHEHVICIVLATVLVCGASLRLAWATDDPVAALCAGVGIVFALTTPACYYASYFVLLALVRPLAVATTFLIASAAMFAVAGGVFFLTLHGYIKLNGAAVYVPVSVALAGVLLSWMIQVSAARSPEMT